MICCFIWSCSLPLKLRCLISTWELLMKCFWWSDLPVFVRVGIEIYFVFAWTSARFLAALPQLPWHLENSWPSHCDTPVSQCIFQVLQFSHLFMPAIFQVFRSPKLVFELDCCQIMIIYSDYSLVVQAILWLWSTSLPCLEDAASDPSNNSE